MMSHSMAGRLMRNAFVLVFTLVVGVGAAAEDFTVQTADGASSFTRSQAKGKYVALHFLLKTECPICLKHTRDYAGKASRLPDVEQVFLKPDAEPAVKQWEEKLKASTGITAPPIYRDEDARLAKVFGIPDGYKFHGETVHYPALILLAPDGREVFRYVGKNNSDRYPFEKLEAKIAELKSLSDTMATTHSVSAR